MHKCWEVILEMETTEVILKGEHILLMHFLWLKPHIPPSPFCTLFLPSCLTHPWGHKKTGTHQTPPKVPTSAEWELESGDKAVAHVFTSHQLCLHICDSEYYRGPVSISNKNIHQKNQHNKWERTAQQTRDVTLLMRMSAIYKIAFVTSGLTKYPVRTVFWEKLCCFLAISQFMEWNPSWTALAYCWDIKVREAKSDFIYQTCLSRKLYGSLPFKCKSYLVQYI